MKSRLPIHSQTKRVAVRATLLVGIALALATFAGLATAAGPAVATDRIASVDGQAAIDGQSAVAVTMDDAPDGVQRYNLTVELSGPSGAQIEEATAGDVEGFEVRSQTDESITFRAADLAENVQSGATNVQLGTVAVAGTGSDDPTVTVTTHDFRNDESQQIDPDLSITPVQSDGAAGSGGDGVGSVAEGLPGTPALWAVVAVGLVAFVAIFAAWRW